MHELCGPPSDPTAEKATVHRTIQLAWHGFCNVVVRGETSHAARETPVLILGSPHRPDRAEYLRDFGVRSEIEFVDLHNCPNGLSIYARVLCGVAVLVLCTVSLAAPVIFRTNSAFERIREIGKLLRCVGHIQWIAPQDVYFFAAYERSANLMALLLSSALSAKVIKIPSPNPLGVHYRTCVADEFILTSPLQISDYWSFHSEWFVSKVWLWRIPGYVTFTDRAYQKLRGDKKTIGLLSGGQWRRKERGDAFDQNRMTNLHAEEQLHDCLGDYLDARPEVTLTIYPHPSEKSEPATYARAVELYHDRIGTDRVSVLHADERTHDHFSDSDVLLSLRSTSALDAVYCGHKVLFVRLNGATSECSNGDFLSKIQVFDRESFFGKLDEFLAMSTSEYFEENGLSEVHHDYYEDGPKLIADCVSPSSVNSRVGVSSIAACPEA